MKDILVFGGADEATREQMARAAATADFAALMGDNHLGYAVPIGGVVAWRDAVSPSGVGFDIGCGNKAVRTNLRAEDVMADAASLADAIQSQISFGVGRRNMEEVDDEVFYDETWLHPVARALKDKARAQLGTVGSGVSRLA